MGIPNLLIWGIGIPVTGLTLLIKFRQRLGTWEVQRYLLMLYQGLNQDKFYWEFINTFRKSLLLSISVFLSASHLFYKVLTATIIMITIRNLQYKLNPYKLKMNNNLELSEITTGTFTIFTSVVFNEDDNNFVILERICFVFSKFPLLINIHIIVIVLNIIFILFWIY